MPRKLCLAAALVAAPLLVSIWRPSPTANPLCPSPSPAVVAAKVVRPLQLPDGSEVAPLNGITEPGRMNWGSRPFAAIVGTVHCQGVDWYRHADGSLSTTVEVFRSDLGRRVPVTLVAHRQVAE